MAVAGARVRERQTAITLPGGAETVAAYLAWMATWRSPARLPTAAPTSETAAADAR